ncbi:hypothetical protein B1219_29425 [Pseudomonas ogarae]|nr:hypothetical protein B1219_29425 [Pseudomonas ogarae]OPG75450.1 hypothetical protein B1218_31665 [Pseudomonas ogarae]
MRSWLARNLCGDAGLWEQSLLAKQAPRLLKDRIACIAGKPCSHRMRDKSLATKSMSVLKLSAKKTRRSGFFITA